MSGTGRRNTGDGHVIVPNRLDLLDPDTLRKLVEFTKDQIETADDFERLHACSNFSEANHISKNDCGVFEMIGDAFGTVTEAVDNLRWKHIPKEFIRVALLLLDPSKVFSFQRAQ